jgi:hypothetical protein
VCKRLFAKVVAEKNTFSPCAFFGYPLVSDVLRQGCAKGNDKADANSVATLNEKNLRGRELNPGLPRDRRKY